MASNFTRQVISSIALKENTYHLKAVPFCATESEWLTIDYIPKAGETIVYDKDSNHNYFRFKTGDGITQASQLSFSTVSPSELEAYVKSEIGSAGHLKREIVEELPIIADADVDTIYMVKASDGTYDEWMLVENAWEIIGSTKVDLSNYITKEELEDKGYITDVAAGAGLKVTKDNNIPTVQIDEEITFIFYCGTSTEVI